MSLDKFRTVHLTVDHADGHFPKGHFVKTSDTEGRRLTVQITDNGEIRDTSGVQMFLAWVHTVTGEKGLDLFEPYDPIQGIYEIYYPEKMLVPGKVTAALIINDGPHTTETRNFTITVERSAVQDYVPGEFPGAWEFNDIAGIRVLYQWQYDAIAEMTINDNILYVIRG